MDRFQTFFHGEMGPQEIACLKSFVDHGFDVTVFCYDGVRVPAFCRRGDANTILPEESLFTYRVGFGTGSFAAYANMFRYALIGKLGGWWIDTDVFCLSDRWPDAAEIAGWQDGTTINNAVFRFLPDSLVLAEAFENCRQLGDRVMWGRTGPDLLTRLLRQHDRLSIAAPPSAFYPVHWKNWLDIIDPVASAATEAAAKTAFCVHLWNEFYTDAGIQTSVAPPEDSFLCRLLVRHDLLHLYARANPRAWERQLSRLRPPPAPRRWWRSEVA